jgi:hypothetical protein
MSVADMTSFDAYSGSIWYCLFYHEVFNRVGIVDEDRVVFLSVVNVPMSNAFWNSHYMTYGDGSETPDMSAFTSLDIVGHEASHGVIEASGGLIYKGESGALNESIADIFGTCLEKYYDNKSGKKLFDWDMGEDIGQNLRSMSNPKSRRQPDTYYGTYWMNPMLPTDNGGVHINSGVSNYLFYLICNGGDGINDKGVSYDIQQNIGIFKAAILIYFSLTGKNSYIKLSNYSSYIDYAKVIESNLRKFKDDFDLSDSKIRVVLESLIAVGLRENNLPPKPPSLPLPVPIPNSPDDVDDDSTQWPPTPSPTPPRPTPTPPRPTPTPPRPPPPKPTPNSPTPDGSLATPRPRQGDTVDLSDVQSSRIRYYGVVYRVDDRIICSSGSQISTYFTVKPGSFNGLELELDLENRIGSVTSNIKYYGSTRTLNKISRVIPPNKAQRKVIITLPRTRNTNYVKIIFIVHGGNASFKNLTIGYY